MKRTSRLSFLALFFLISALLTGCASTSSTTVIVNDDAQGEAREVTTSEKDPFEKINRSILKFNLKADQYVLKPVAKTYKRAVPSPVRNGVRNFFSNLWEPMTAVNNLLQGKFVQAGRSTSRFVINTTLGFFGLNDIAKHMNLPRQKEDFGQTLAVWGVPSGPYLVLPFLGPSNLRDTFGLIPQMKYADAVSFVDAPQGTYLGITRLVDQRAALLGADRILDIQPDKYLFLREGYRSRRLSQIHDGNPPQQESVSDDELLDELDELLDSDT